MDAVTRGQTDPSFQWEVCAPYEQTNIYEYLEVQLIRLNQNIAELVSQASSEGRIS